jgi:hypothetical protein
MLNYTTCINTVFLTSNRVPSSTLLNQLPEIMKLIKDELFKLCVPRPTPTVIELEQTVSLTYNEVYFA